MSSSNRKKQVSMLRYWSIRYLTVLCIGLVCIGLLSSYVLRQNTLNHRLNVNQFVAQEIAERITTIKDHRAVGQFVKRIMNDRLHYLQSPKDTHLSIVDVDGRVLFTHGPPKRQIVVMEHIIEGQSEPVKIIMPNNEKGYLVSHSIQENDTLLGWVVIIQSQSSLMYFQQEFRLFLIMLVVFAVMGWVTIYLLTKRMAKPIKLVSQAAIHVREGNYDFVLPQKVQEMELASLVDSFQAMSNRLEQLESLRSELLAGVTHELKTPVTSISSLLQTVKDGVVDGEQAKEFIDISLKEADRLNRMVGDLLDFNSFAAGAVTVQMEQVQIQPLLKEIVNQWQLVHDPAIVQTFLQLPEEPIVVSVDSLRLQQIIINLLNNAMQAIQGRLAHQSEHVGRIEVRLKGKAIEVIDNGIGIPEEEQSLIFERFFRGRDKLLRVRGMGLGLPYSQMAAKAMGGELSLKSSSPVGTVFVLKLSRVVANEGN